MSSQAIILCMILWTEFNKTSSWQLCKILVNLASSRLYLQKIYLSPIINYLILKIPLVTIISAFYTYTTRKTFENTTEPSAKYWYRIRISFSSVEYFTNVDNTVNVNTCMVLSVMTSGSSRILLSFETDKRSVRSFRGKRKKKRYLKAIREKCSSVSSYILWAPPEEHSVQTAMTIVAADVEVVAGDPDLNSSTLSRNTKVRRINSPVYFYKRPPEKGERFPEVRMKLN